MVIICNLYSEVKSSFSNFSLFSIQLTNAFFTVLLALSNLELSPKELPKELSEELLEEPLPPKEPPKELSPEKPLSKLLSKEPSPVLF